MKKTFKVLAMALSAAAMLFSSCASTGAKSDAGYTPVHPREYTLDLSDSKTGNSIAVVYNEYGPNYQSQFPADYTKNVRKDKPQAGDTIHVYYKFSTDIDVGAIRISLVDPTVNYWLELAPDEAIILTDLKAGEIYEGSKDIVLTADVKGEFKVYFCWDNADLLNEGYAKVGAAGTVTLYDVEGVESTDVEKELPASEQSKGPKTINIEINKICAFCDIVTGHPWIDGKQIMSEIENYQADISYSQLLEEEPQPGDILVVTWKGKADRDIAELKCMPVDHSASVGWWRIMINDSDNPDNVVIARDIKAGEVFEVTKTYVIDIAAESTDCNLRVWYEYDAETNGPGPCTIIGQK